MKLQKTTALGEKSDNPYQEKCSFFSKYFTNTYSIFTLLDGLVYKYFTFTTRLCEFWIDLKFVRRLISSSAQSRITKVHGA